MELAESSAAHSDRCLLYQVVLEHVYLSVLLRVVRSVALDDRGGAVVLVLGGMRVEDVH